MRVKNKYNTENKKKITQSVRSAQSARSVCGLQSAVRMVCILGLPSSWCLACLLEHSNNEIRFSFVKHSSKTTRTL